MKKKAKNDHRFIETKCPICLQSYSQPVELKCGHIYCFLCIKGSLNQRPECAICRTEIDESYIKNPKRIKLEKDPDESQISEDKETSWFYKGYRGWWEYDTHTRKIIEEEFGKNTRKFEVLIAGNMYTVNLKKMVQYRSENKKQSRSIRRDSKKELSSTEQVKGMAGLSDKI